MNTTIKAALLATVAIGAINTQAKAQVMVVAPATDSLLGAANGSLITQITHQLSMLSSLAQQITQLTDLVSLATVASTALGDTVSPELGQLFSQMTGTYSSTNQAYGSMLAVPANIDRELALFQPPPAGWESMSLPQLVNRAQQLRKLTAGTNSAAVSRQADVIERRVEIAAAAARANGMTDRSISALSASQAVGQQMRVTGQILNQIEQTNSDIAATAALKMQQDISDKDMGDGLRKQGVESWKQMVAGGASSPAHSALEWGK